MKSSRVKGFLAGELIGQSEVDRLKVQIPVAAGVDLAALGAGEFVYARAGKVGVKTRNGRVWTERALKRFAEMMPLYGYIYPGHQAGPRSNGYVSVWVGGELLDGQLYVKGRVLAGETGLKERIATALAAGKPMQVSPFGYLQTRFVDGVDVVDDAEPMSIDWGNPGEAGFGADGDVVGTGELTETEETTMTEKEIQELQAKNLQLGGELKTAQDALAAATAKVTTLEGTVTSLGGELKTLKDAAAETAKAGVKAHRETLLGKLPEPERELGGELLAGETVADLDKNFDVVVAKLKKARPGLRIIGGEMREKDGGKGNEEKDFGTD